MSTPQGIRQWIGVLLALVVVVVGLTVLHNIRVDAELAEHIVDVGVALAIAVVATLVWWGWSALRKFDSPGHPAPPPETP
jgi:membrane protein DedA with SNARE-associated domain